MRSPRGHRSRGVRGRRGAWRARGRLAAVAAFLALASGCARRQATDDPGALTSAIASFEAGVRASEAARAAALVSRDSLALDTLLASDLSYTHSNAVRESREDMQRSVRTGSIRYDSLSMSAQEFGRVGAAVLVMGEARARVLVAPATAPVSIRLRYTSVYRQRGRGPAGEPGRGWELVAWQSTRIPEPAP